MGSRFSLLRFFSFVLVCLTVVSKTNYVAAQQPILQLSTNIDYFFDVEWSNNGQWIAVATSEGIIIYDSSLQEVTRLQTHSGNVTSLSWSPDDLYLATSGGIQDSAVRIWNWNSINHSLNLAVSFLQNNEFGFIQKVAWSPDGTRLAVLGINQPPGSNDVVGTIQIWNSITWSLDTTLVNQYENPSLSLEWSPDSATIAGAGYDQNNGFVSYVTDINTGELLLIVPYVEAATSVAISANNNLAVGIRGVPIYDLLTLQPLSVINIPNAGLLQWIPDQDWIAIVGGETGQIIDARTNMALFNFDTIPSLRDIEIHPDGIRLAEISFDGDIKVWDISNLSSEHSPTITPLFTRSATITPTQTFTITSTPSPLNKLAFAMETGFNEFRSKLLTSDLNGSNINQIPITVDYAFDPV